MVNQPLVAAAVPSAGYNCAEANGCGVEHGPAYRRVREVFCAGDREFCSISKVGGSSVERQEQAGEQLKVTCRVCTIPVKDRG